MCADKTLCVIMTASDKLKSHGTF